jgi:hypothetical protein
MRSSVPCEMRFPVDQALPASVGLQCLAVLVLSVSGCSLIPRQHVEPLPVVTEVPPTIKADSGAFFISAGMLDTWNAIGEIVVRMSGVTYESRAQMLGLYEVRYRGEKLLIVTRAQVVNSQGRGMSTRVSALGSDGKPSDSAAATELLGMLETRLPEELRRIANGERGRKP